ncbi:MAG: ferredoxin [Candidatus Pacebacteria bacterium]|jgi:ferredoxin|nr:ferredoxin [Candidatus Paceibacterota bacterium]
MGDKKIAKITVDRGLCIGAGSCLTAVEGVYELDEENKAVMLLKGDLKNSGPIAKGDLVNDGAADEAILSSAQVCPVMAIILHDENGEQIYP